MQAVLAVIVSPVDSSTYGFIKLPLASLLVLAISTYSSIEGINFVLINEVSSSKSSLNIAAAVLIALGSLLVLAWKYANVEPAANKITKAKMVDYLWITRG